MSAIAQNTPTLDPAALAQGSLSPSDLAELMTAFTEVTTKLERTHAQLRGEVSRLNAELREANEALQRSKRLAALGEMAAGISHEIRNPLGSIRLYASMLSEDLQAAGGMDPQREIVDKIGRAVRGLDEIVGDVLAFSREIKAQWRPADASDIVTCALEMCCADISCSVVREGLDEPIELVCDAHLVQQALVNILRNAGEANRVSQGGAITVSVARGAIRGENRDEPAVMFCVSDEGDGVAPEVIERMFNPFFTTRAAGTGLGLAIVHRIVDAHRGAIEVVNNSPERGARVSITLPQRQPIVVTRGAPGAGESLYQPQRASLRGAMG